MPQKINIFWFRRDLRLNDNAGLFHALQARRPVLPVFIFDSNILNELEDKDDKRVGFIHSALTELQVQLEKTGCTFDVRYGSPIDIFKNLLNDYEVDTVFCNHDYEPYAISRDNKIKEMLGAKGVSFQTYKDQVIFEMNDIVKDDGSAYSVYTPFSKKWKALLDEKMLKPFDTTKLLDNFLPQKKISIPSLKEMGFNKTEHPHVNEWNEDAISGYHKTRDIPSINGTTKIGIHLRFGTVSIRKIVKETKKLNDTFLNELIWREFFMQMLWRQPTLVNHCCKPEYENIQWRNNEKEFESWCQGQTGYPIVDAGMRQLNETGFMHNRVRMITASFFGKTPVDRLALGRSLFCKKIVGL